MHDDSQETTMQPGRGKPGLAAKEGRNMMFATRLRAARERRDLPSNVLGKRAGIDPTRISHYETGVYEPNLTSLIAICKALDVTADYLLGLSEETRRLDVLS